MIDEVSLRAAVVVELYNASSNDDPDYWVKVMAHPEIDPSTGRPNREPSSQFTADWPYWQHRIATGDGVGKAPHADTPLPAPSLPAPALPGPSATLVLAALEALEARVMARFGTLDAAIATAAAPQAFTGTVAIAYLGNAPITLTAKKPAA